MKKVDVKIKGPGCDVTAKGYAVGPFVVHKLLDAWMNNFFDTQYWGVTHAATGCSAACGPTKSSCMRAARRLRDVGVDWDFENPSAVKDFPAEKIDAICVIRALSERGVRA